ncbi:hypothetical protein LTR99_001066 [Exophiala xenobiotica]|uniref:Uncharacterized protein n=1 Tax=Vermiconidia calcicola TaxID=1690605 RepID=A0AAV9QL64_9PEZI|nr:hypothetical protein LTR92_001498 [Exophiala xenobiotica]KAK5308093.1 hypothetical protein LTR99_001066 [Exophiala xenobiotica]KAK5437591.1 hypothetical protein LTR34_001136 [Exophiala xenobiotica]KAK5545628.1 hypothetical protein LTR25_000636 [Vermiconidia calcicola]
MASNQDLSRGLTKTPTAFAERFKARIAGKIREQQVTPPAPIDELLRLSQERRSRAIAHLAGPATHLTAQSPQFHTATPALPPLPATAPLTGPVELSGQNDINQYAVDTSDERDNYEMRRWELRMSTSQVLMSTSRVLMLSSKTRLPRSSPTKVIRNSCRMLVQSIRGRVTFLVDRDTSSETFPLPL